MTEDSPKMTSHPLQRQGLAGHQSEATDHSSTHTFPSVPQSSNEKFTKLYQQRQKNELKRLLKYTHPELKTLEGVVDEELAEVLSSESGLTAGETGYEGEVLSRRWIFENAAPSNSMSPPTASKRLAAGTVGQGEGLKTSGRFKQSQEPLEKKERANVTMGSAREEDVRPEEPNECDAEIDRIDVLSARRMFESQSTEGYRVSLQDGSQGRVVVSEDEKGAVQKRKKAIETRSNHAVHRENKSNVSFKNMELTTPFHKQSPGVSGVGLSPTREVSANRPSQEGAFMVKATFERQPAMVSKAAIFREGDNINKSRPLFQNNPFISTCIAGEQSQHKTSAPVKTAVDDKAKEEMLMAKVKNRAQLFESMPFDRINHHSKEEMQTMVEDMNESLVSLCRFKAIHSHGSIIEVNETGIAKKAKYLLSQGRAEIQHEEVAEGGAQNFILQLLPRASLKPQVAYLKENEGGKVAVTMVDVPVQQHIFTVNQDKEFRTANAAQLIEDILNQDNSLRKGVIIQENAQGLAEVTVYSLYHYAEGDVKTYIPPQEMIELDAQDSLPGSDDAIGACGKRNGDVRSTINSLLATTQDNSCPASIRPKDNIKGNVKLFRSFIEKGDLENLKTFNADPSEQELPTVQNETGDSVEQNDPEWAPVDVKKLKNMFSSNVTNLSCVLPKQMTDGKVLSAKLAKVSQRQTPAERQEEEYYNHSVTQEQETNQYLGDGGHGRIKSHETASCTEAQNEDIVHLAELVRVVDDDEEIEISNLQAAIHSLQQATIQAKTIHHVSEEKQLLTAQSLLTQPDTLFSMKAPNEEVYPNTEQSKSVGSDSQISPFQLTLIAPEQTSKHQKNTEISYTNAVLEGPSEVQEDAESIQKGHVKAALDSLECATTDRPQEDNDDVAGGTLQAALDSLGRSSGFNTSKGDFRAAMIYRNYSKSCTENPQQANIEFVSKLSDQKVGPQSESPVTLSVTTSKVGQVSTEELSTATAELPSPSQTTNNLATCPSSEKQSLTLCASDTRKSKRPSGPKPTIPPKPHHLQAISGEIKQSTKSENLNKPIQAITEEENETLQIVNKTLSIKPMSYKDALCKGLSQKDSLVTLSQQNELDSEKNVTNVFTSEAIQVKEDIKTNHQVEGSKVTPSRNIDDDCNIVFPSNRNKPGKTEEGKCPQSCKEGNEMSTDEVNVGSSEVCQKFGDEREVAAKRTPVKPKRVRIALCENNTQIQTSEENTPRMNPCTDSQQVLTGQRCHSSNTCEGSVQQHNNCKEQVRAENQVVMRKKKVRSETQDELRQRLSVHMDGIIRENATAAMEIINHMREQEELQKILTTVEEIERDTSEVDVRSLKNVFEKVSEWVGSPQVKKPKPIDAVHTVQLSRPAKDNTESMNSMANVFGDLEKASEEIIHLKEQTLARLMDIEGAIKKALYSVSTLKSEADISGLSVLFKESLGTAKSSPNASNIKTISIGSSRTKTPQAKEAPDTQSIRRLSDADQKPGEEIPAAKNKSSPPSSPAFISIQSAARKNVELPPLAAATTAVTTCKQSLDQEEIFQSTKTLSCNRTTPNKKKGSRKKVSTICSRNMFSLFKTSLSNGENDCR
ncbi:xin actin-binding repeat-containing protein 1 [Aplochiton taeniatus]